MAVIADAHLGTADARAVELARYLRSIAPQTLVIAGDLVDARALRARPLPAAHAEVLRVVLDIAQSGARVYYLSGDRDAELRRLGDLALGSLHFRRDLTLRLDGEDYYFCHGDALDGALRYGPGASLRERLSAALRAAFGWSVDRLLGRRPRSLARELRAAGAPHPELERYVERYVEAAARLARERECSTVVCAHVHRAAIREVEVDGAPVRYLNAGDWLGSCTALEYRFGQWSVRAYDPDDDPEPHRRLRVATPREAPTRSPHRDREGSLLAEIVRYGPTPH